MVENTEKKIDEKDTSNNSENSSNSADDIVNGSANDKRNINKPKTDYKSYSEDTKKTLIDEIKQVSEKPDISKPESDTESNTDNAKSVKRGRGRPKGSAKTTATVPKSAEQIAVELEKKRQEELKNNIDVLAEGWNNLIAPALCRNQGGDLKDWVFNENEKKMLLNVRPITTILKPSWGAYILTWLALAAKRMVTQLKNPSKLFSFKRNKKII